MSSADPARLVWIGLASARGAARVAVVEARVEVGTGLAGHWHAKERPGGDRQVTLMAEEDLAAAAHALGRPVPPERVLRNLMTRGVDLNALRGRRFHVGAVLLEGTKECTPCEHMAAGLGPGALEALRGRGGLCARVVEGGALKVGDAVLYDLLMPRMN